MLLRKPYIYTLAAAIAALSMWGCADDPVRQVPIEYSVYTGQEESRAITTVPLDGEVYSVYVRGIHSNGSSYTNSYFGTGTTPYKLDYNDGKFVATDYFFPLSGTLKVLACGLNSTKASDGSYVTGRVKMTQSGIGFNRLDVDLSGSDGTREIIYSDISTVQCPVSGGTTVPLHLHTPYASLRFSFIPSDAKSCEQLIINKIEVPAVSWQGKYYVNFNTDGTAKNPVWTTQSAAATKTITFTSTQKMAWDKATDTAIPLVQDLFLVKETATRPQIIIYYTVKNDTILSGNLKDNDDNVRQLRYVIDADAANSWLFHHQYHYNITVRGNCQMELTEIAVKKMETQATGTMNI